jgi:copper resistance protein B
MILNASLKTRFTPFWLQLLSLLLGYCISISTVYAQNDQMIFSHFRAERIEYEGNNELQLFKWDVQDWIGNDHHKLWIKSEGDYSADQAIVGRADLQLLYSHNIDTFWDFQIGVRRAFEPERTYDAVIGFQGLAPYFIEVDTALFFASNGNVLGRLGLTYDVLLTQRLILEPRIELNLSARDIKHRNIKAGVTEFEAGMRLRYEIEREFAPYIGFDYVEEQSLKDHQHSIRLVAGIRIWY